MTMHPAVRNGAYDVARVREDFPALAMKVYGKPLVYLDNAASAQKPTAVLDRMTEAYKSEYANVHRGLHYLANTATEAYEGGRAKVAKFLNAGRAEEIVFTRNATEAINLVASSWGEPNIKAGDEIVISIMEHHSNIVPWHFLRERHGAVIKWAPVDDEGNFLLDEFEKLLGPRTKMVATTHMSNMLGTVVPIKEVVRLAHARGIPVLVDGGIRRGTDVLKALALGATAVQIGRPYLYGLGVAGADGVKRVVEILRGEFEMAMMLTGRPTLKSIDKTVLW
jgi:cysteine desulfurase/selenocysteine lyase